jgi:hypothetical protein
MTNLSTQVTFEEAKNAAKVLGLTLIEANIGFELWLDDSYQGGFVTLAAAINEINLQRGLAEAWDEVNKADQMGIIQEQNKKRAAKLEVSRQISGLLSGATEAAVMYRGEVIGLCNAVGNSIQIAGEMVHNGQPLNVMEVKVSRSVKNLKQAQEKEFFGPHLFNGEIYYVK